MNLWIRSQDGECLMKVDRLDIDYTNGTYKIKAGGYQTQLAEYESKTRALEVLDEIYNGLKVDINIDASYEVADIYMKNEILKQLAKVYYMPKE